MESRDRWAKLIFFAMLFMLAALAIYAYLGTFTRYMADDYCTAAALKNDGFWGAQAYWWQNWSGRYSFTFVVSFVELIGLRIVPILPALLISLWLFSAVWACLPILKKLQVSNYILIGISAASLMLWLTYQSVDDYPQIVFWQTGILTYPVSPILFLLGAGIAVRRALNAARITWWELLCWFLFAFIAGGFSETGVVVQIALLASIFVFLNMAKNEQNRIVSPILLATICGSILALLVKAFAPGNVVRSGGFKDIPSLSKSLIGSFTETLVFIPKLVDQHTVTFVFGLLAGVFLVYFCVPEDIHVSNLSVAKQFVISFVLAEVGTLAGIVPAYILRGGIPPERVLLFAYFMVAGLTIYWGALSAVLLRLNLPKATRTFQGWISLALLMFFIALGVIPVMASQSRLIPPLQNYVTLWDKRHQSLLVASQSGETAVVTDDITRMEALRKLKTKLWLTGDFETNSDFWINACAAQYYGVNQILTK